MAHGDRGRGSGGAPALAWVSLDEQDNDPVTFWTYVITALRDGDRRRAHRRPDGDH